MHVPTGPLAAQRKIELDVGLVHLDLYCREGGCHSKGGGSCLTPPTPWRNDHAPWFVQRHRSRGALDPNKQDGGRDDLLCTRVYDGQHILCTYIFLIENIFNF